jgi:hypothetical protein
LEAPKLSIYQTRHKFPVNFDGSQTDRRPGAPWIAPRPPNGHGVLWDWSSRRKAQPTNLLLPASREWLGSLPVDVRPKSLVAQFPRIVNALAAEWADPVACNAYFANLHDNRRGDRTGFPANVQRDLLTLRDFYYAVHLTLAG